MVDISVAFCPLLLWWFSVVFCCCSLVVVFVLVLVLVLVLLFVFVLVCGLCHGSLKAVTMQFEIQSLLFLV